MVNRHFRVEYIDFDTQEVIMYHSKFINFCAIACALKLMVIGAFILPSISKSSVPQVRLQGNEQCAICMTSAAELGNNQARFTNCCRQYLCAKDAQEIEKTAHSRRPAQQARCPYCRHTPLRTIRPTVNAPASRAPARDAQAQRSQPNARPQSSPLNNARPNNAEQEFQRWLSRQPNAKKCPTPGCSYAFINERATPDTIVCIKCLHEYCSDCLVRHSVHISCNQAREQMRQSVARANHAQSHNDIHMHHHYSSGRHASRHRRSTFCNFIIALKNYIQEYMPY
jgi:hypothetical protein